MAGIMLVKSKLRRAKNAFSHGCKLHQQRDWNNAMSRDKYICPAHRGHSELLDKHHSSTRCSPFRTSCPVVQF